MLPLDRSAGVHRKIHRMGQTNNQFRLKLPDGWEDRTVHSLVGPEDGGEQTTLLINIEPKPESTALEEYASLRMAQARSTLPGMEVESEGEVTLPSGRKCLGLVCHWSHPDGRVLIRRHFYLMIDGTGYTCWVDLSKRANKMLVPQITSIVDTIESIT